MNRQPNAFTTEVLGIVKKPREFLSIQTLRPASPVFSPDGKLVGISIIRKSTGTLSQGSGQPGVPAVLPARDVLKIADQARTAKPEKAGDAPEKKDDKYCRFDGLIPRRKLWFPSFSERCPMEAQRGVALRIVR